MNKILNGLLFLIKNIVTPHKQFPILLEKSPIITVIGVITSQLIISIIFIGIISVTPKSQMMSDLPYSITNIFYVILFLLPLCLALPAMYFHWIAQVMKGKGRLLAYYKLILWSILPITLVILIFGFIVSSLAAMFSLNSDILSVLMFLQLIPIVFYMLASLKIAHDISWIRAFFIYLIGGGIIAVSKLIFL